MNRLWRLLVSSFARERPSQRRATTQRFFPMFFV